MSLREIAFGAALAFTGSCATGLKPVCSYEQDEGQCTRKYKNATVYYSVLASAEYANNQLLCIVDVIYPSDIFHVWDVGCDGTADQRTDYKLFEGLVGDVNTIYRDMSNKEHDKLFGEFEKLFKDKAFQKLKKKVLGGKK